jgi:hypothetical protein
MARDRKLGSVNQPRGRQLELGDSLEERPRPQPTPQHKVAAPVYEERVLTWMLTREKSIQKKHTPVAK